MVRLCALVLVLMTSDGACAQNWPSRPIRAIVPYTAGGAIDIVSRTVAQQLSLQLGYPIVIESRPGAGGVIGTAAVAKADPDGHTILLTASSHTISPWAYSNLPYDTVGDLARITPLANLPNVLVVAPAANIRSRRRSWPPHGPDPAGSTTHRAEAAARPTSMPKGFASAPGSTACTSHSRAGRRRWPKR
jgi:tripartite-type tricarboxylate transporter receptor subunit TctC